MDSRKQFTSKLKEDIKAVLQDEIGRIVTGKTLSTRTREILNEVISSDNIHQEIENILHSFAKPYMDTENRISRLERQLDNESSKSRDLLKMYNEEKDRNKSLHERNKRLSEANKRLERGISRADRKIKRCNHVKVSHTNDGVRVKSLIKTKQVEKGLYKLECTKCNKRF